MKIKKKLTVIFLLIIFCFSNCGTNRSTAGNNTRHQALKTVYKDYFLVGNIISGRYMTGEYYDLLTAHFNIVTCENHMKPDHLAPRERGGQYNWTQADNMVN